MNQYDFDVVIVGAGLSGIGAACHLEKSKLEKKYLVLESRNQMGGTWDLFRYPGIRSDSDMHTLGYSFKPWREQKAIADGFDIRNYIRESANEYGVDKHIRYGHTLIKASWQSDRARWNLIISRRDGEPLIVNCNFIYSCTGYYRYDSGYMPNFDGLETFSGRLIHPQHWPEDLDYTGKTIAVVGSGATAITIVPTLAKKAAHVTMLQRSPTYVVSMPTEDAFANGLRRWLPQKLAYRLTRLKNIFQQTLIYYVCKKYPEYVKRTLRKLMIGQLGHNFDVDTHFNPKYGPWDQRLCLAPNGDLFKSLVDGSVTILTDCILRFTETGIALKSGESIEADIIVTATGLDLLPLGGVIFTVDDKVIDISDTVTFKGMMLSGIPNLLLAVGYTNASWTLKCDLTSEYFCKLLGFMDGQGYQYCRCDIPANMQKAPIIDFSSGYVKRAIHSFPNQGTRRPWRLHQNYFLDLFATRFGSFRHSGIKFFKSQSNNNNRLTAES